MVRLDYDTWYEINEERLLDVWHEYKYDHYCGEYFHHDDVDWYNEDFFMEMVEKLWLDEQRYLE